MKKLTNTQRKLMHTWFVYVMAGIVVLTAIFPFYYAVMTSFKTGADLFQTTYFPTSMDFSNYFGVLFENRIAHSAWNSFLVASLVVLLCLLVSFTASYALARVKFKGRKYILFTILSVSMFPQVAILSGMFELVRFLGLYDTLGALVMSYTTFSLPFTIWVLTTFMKQIPEELEEAARVDGANPIQIIFQIFAPVMIPPLITTGMLAFIGAWNEFMFSLTFVLSNDKRTVPVAISMISGASEFELPWGRIMAASVLVTTPIILFVLIFQRRIVSGLTAGAVKG